MASYANSFDLNWVDDATFKTKNFQFKCTTTNFKAKTDNESIALLKSKDFLTLYSSLLTEPVNSVFEIGFFNGGMPLLLADTIRPGKIVAVDQNPPNEATRQHAYKAGYSDIIKFHAPIDQGDSAKIRKLLDAEFGQEPIDLIIDDCSHFYELSRKSFEATFGYLKPRGRYILEDWGWAHWDNKFYQGNETHYRGKPAMTNLLFELVMAHATSPGVIARIDIINPAMAVITRGKKLAHGAQLKLSDLYLTAGRKFTPL